MHELGITRNVVAIVAEHAGDKNVRRVTLDIGKLSAIMPDAIRFCFDICCKGTRLEGALLTINEIPGRGRCEACNAEMEMDRPGGKCHCGNNHIKCIAGEEMKIKEMEVY